MRTLRLFIPLLACFGGMIDSAAAQPGAQAPAMDLDAKVVEAWEKAGAKKGWHGTNPGGFVYANPVSGALPGFELPRLDADLLANLPPPDEPFALSLRDPRQKGATLKSLVRFKNLRALSMFGSLVTDAELNGVGSLKQLKILHLNSAHVTDTGLKEVALLTELEVLNLGNTRMGDAALKELAPLKALHTLDLIGANVTDDGMKHVAALKKLHTVRLFGTKVTNAGLKELDGLKELRTLNVERTAVTVTGVASLQKALPDLKVTGAKPASARELIGEDVAKAWEKAGATVGWRSDSRGLGTFGSKTNPKTSRPALYIRKVEPGVIAKLPAPLCGFALDLADASFTDAHLEDLVGFKNLELLDLQYSKVTDAGMKELAALTNLKTLCMGRLGINFTGEGMKHLVGLKHLRTLFFYLTPITDAGLKEIAALEKLEILHLAFTKVTAPGMKVLAGHKKLEVLYLAGNVSDAHLRDLPGLPNLRTLQLFQTGVTSTGIDELKKANPKLMVGGR